MNVFQNYLMFFLKFKIELFQPHNVFIIIKIKNFSLKTFKTFKKQLFININLILIF